MIVSIIENPALTTDEHHVLKLASDGQDAASPKFISGSCDCLASHASDEKNQRSERNATTHITKGIKQMNKQALFSIAVVATLLAGGVHLVGSGPAHADLPNLFGKAQRPLPKGAVQVDDLKSDPKGYAGTILVRGVVAKVTPNGPHSVALIDSREARTCASLTCAKFYLPINSKTTNLKPWDEVNVRGTIANDPNKKTVYLVADSVENIGSIKK